MPCFLLSEPDAGFQSQTPAPDRFPSHRPTTAVTTTPPIPRARADPSDAGSAVAAEGPPWTVLLLAAEGEPWGLTATEAAEEAGLQVRRYRRPGALLDALEDDPERVTAVLAVDRTLTSDGLDSWAARLGDRTAEARLPMLVLTDNGHAADTLKVLDALPHVTLLPNPPADRVLSTLLRTTRREQERRLRVRELLHRLEEAGQREERLLAQVGHELRNPLGAITSALTLMRELGPEEEDPIHRYRRLIERQVVSLTRAVDDLLEVTGDRVTHLASGKGGSAEEDDSEGGDRRRGDRDDGNGHRRSVLLVEDDTDGRHALSELLRMWGYEVLEAADGETGVEAASGEPPQVVLVDIGLPGIDGYEVARRIRHQYPEPPPLLIAMTGFGQPEDRRRALDAGFDLHMVKPIRPARLAELLQEELPA